VPRGFPLLLGLVIAAGVAVLACGTEGFRVVTSEGARRLAVERAPRPVPNVALIDQNGARLSLGDYRGKPLLVTFIFTTCPTLCGAVGDAFQRVLALPRQRDAVAAPELLSISFDLARDGPRELNAYAARHGAAVPRWRVAVPVAASGLQALIKAFGVVAIADGLGGFTHNAAIYLVDRHARLARILDPDAPAGVIERAVQSAS
jgi:protein SCO1